MTWLQVAQLGFVVVILFGSFTLGRYFRRRDDRHYAEWSQEPIRPLPNFDHIGDAKLVEFRRLYLAELDRLVMGYHRRALFDGEAEAKQWLLEQTDRTSQ